MRKPRPEAFDPKTKARQPDPVDMTGVVPLRPHPVTSQSVFQAPVSASPESETDSSSYETNPIVPKTDPALSHTVTLLYQVRKAVKEFGKEAATYRFTAAEKQALAEIIYDYRRRGLRTTENEITRIAINYLFYEYQQNKEQSLLHQLLTALKE